MGLAAAEVATAAVIAPAVAVLTVSRVDTESGVALVGVMVVAFVIAVFEWWAQNPPTKVCVRCAFATRVSLVSCYTEHSRRAQL